MLLKNIGTTDYTGNGAEIGAGHTEEVTAEVGAYLLGDDSPGTFEEVKAAKEVKAGK